MNFAGPYTSGAAVGGDGVATANADTPIVLKGLLYGIYIEYLDSPPAGTTDVTIATAGDGIPEAAVTLEDISNAATDGWFFPRLATVDAANAATTDDYGLYPVHDKINVKIAQANAGDSVNVWFALVDSD